MPSIKSKIAELEQYIAKTSKPHVDKVNTIIALYKNRQITNIKSALNTVKLVASAHKKGYSEKEAIAKYHKLVNRYEDAPPVTGLRDPRIPFYTVIRGDYTKAQTHTKISLKNARDFYNVFKYGKDLIINELKMALAIKASFKMRLRANASLLTNAVDDEGHEDIRLSLIHI